MTDEKTEEVQAEVTYEVPSNLCLNEFRKTPHAELYRLAEELPLRFPPNATKSQLVFCIASFYAQEGSEILATGVIERAKDNFVMIRDPKCSFKNREDDLYLAGHQAREFGLAQGHFVKVKIRPPRPKDKYLSVIDILEIEGLDPKSFKIDKGFDQLTSMFPEDRFILERPDSASARILDLVSPMGKGQRGIIVAPPRGGKTILLKQIAQSIQQNHAEVELIVLLLDERPEEVSDFEETVDAQVFSSTFDEPSKRHAQVSDLVLERAKRLVELGKDVVILLDSLTRLARGYNNGGTHRGPVGSGGLNPQALQRSRKFFGAARNVEEGGSLTVVATCLVETENRMDDIIFEELKGTGNMEIKLDQDLAERRIFPAIHIAQSGTRNDERLYHQDEVQRIQDIRRQLASVPVGEAVELLLSNLAKRGTNAELLLSGLR